MTNKYTARRDAMEVNFVIFPALSLIAFLVIVHHTMDEDKKNPSRAEFIKFIRELLGKDYQQFLVIFLLLISLCMLIYCMRFSHHCLVLSLNSHFLQHYKNKITRVVVVCANIVKFAVSNPRLFNCV